MAARAIVGLLAISVCAHTPSWAGDGVGEVITPEPPEGAPSADDRLVEPGPPVEPFIHPEVAENVRARLEAGLELAADRLRTVKACNDLFARLGADGIQMLNTGLYFEANSFAGRIRVCGRDGAASSWGGRTLAYTKVGAAATWLCRRFARVPTEIAAVTLIHEALHHAGLPEWPEDRLAMTSEEITRMVKKACEFD